MKHIIIFPTIEEAKSFILTEPHTPVFVAGVGTAEIAAATIRAVKAKKPQLVVLAGFAGACDRNALSRGQVVEVVTERIAGIPARYACEYETSAPDTGLEPVAGITVNRSGDGMQVAEKSVKATEEPAKTDEELAKTDEELAEDDLPLVENMEGAAFFAVCEALGVAGCEIRAISNYVGEPFEEWDTELAAARLTETLTKIFKSDE